METRSKRSDDLTAARWDWPLTRPTRQALQWTKLAAMMRDLGLCAGTSSAAWERISRRGRTRGAQLAGQQPQPCLMRRGGAAFGASSDGSSSARISTVAHAQTRQRVTAGPQMQQLPRAQYQSDGAHLLLQQSRQPGYTAALDAFQGMASLLALVPQIACSMHT